MPHYGKRISKEGLAFLTHLLDHVSAEFPGYEDELQEISVIAGQYVFTGCSEPTCPACLAGTEPGCLATYKVLAAIAAVNDGEAPEGSIESLDLTPVLVTLFNASLKGEDKRAEALASCLDLPSVSAARAAVACMSTLIDGIERDLKKGGS